MLSRPSRHLSRSPAMRPVRLGSVSSGLLRLLTVPAPYRAVHRRSGGGSPYPPLSGPPAPLVSPSRSRRRDAHVASDSVTRWERNPPPPPIPPRPSVAAPSQDLDFDTLVNLAATSTQNASPQFTQLQEEAEAAIMDEMMFASPGTVDPELDRAVFARRKERDARQSDQVKPLRKSKSRRSDILLNEGLTPDVEPDFVDGRPLPRPLPNLLPALRRPPPKRRSMRLSPIPTTESATQIRPYLPPSLPPLHEATPAEPLPQPHHYPLHSRHDWRLSSPLRRYVDATPPSLHSAKDTNTLSQGHNRLVGVGIEAANVHNEKEEKFRWRERWGFKRPASSEFRGDWPDAELYRERCVLPPYSPFEQALTLFASQV